MTYSLAWDGRTESAVRLLVAGETMFKRKAVLAPCHVLAIIDMWTELLNIEGEVPIYHVLSHIVAILVVSSHPRVAISFDIEGVG